MPFFDPIRIGASGAEDGYTIDRSIRISRDKSSYFSISNGGNTQTFTFSFWMKLGKIYSDFLPIYSHYLTGSNRCGIVLTSGTGSAGFQYQNRQSGSHKALIDPVERLRDHSAWYHVVFRMDTTNGTQADRFIIYVNGRRIEFSSGSIFVVQNSTSVLNSSTTHYIGQDGYYGSGDFYLADIHLIDGQAYDASYFGKTDDTTGEWIPIEYTGGYTGSSYHLTFSDNSSVSALGTDSSGLGNDVTPHSFDVGTGDDNDCKTDTPTNSIATLNPQTGFTYRAALQEGNLKMTGSSGFKEISTIAFPGTSKFYYELVRTNAAGWQLVGVFVGQPDNPSNALSNSAVWGFASTQATYFGGNYTSTNDCPDWGNNDVMGIKYENGTLKLYKNGTLATATTSSIPTDDIIFAYIANDNTNSAAYVRFNSDDWTQDSAAGVDSTWALSKANMSDPAIAKSADHFNTLLYTGNGSTNNITGLNFQPDFVWVKRRDGAAHHNLIDSVRGTQKHLQSSNKDTEDTETGSNGLTSFNSDGFTVSGTNSGTGRINYNGNTFVGWCWNGGGSTVTNTTGSISAQVRANPTAGFSIVSYTGTGNTSDTIGHGLGVKPDCIIVKSRNVAGQDWIVYNKNLDGGNQPATHALKLNGYGSEWDLNDVWYDTEPTSSVFTVGNEAMVNYNSSSTYIAYCFSGVEGFSKFGIYTGNGNNSGTFVYTGFKPALVITRGTHGTSWYMLDNKRNPYNPVDVELNSNNDQSDSGTSLKWCDFLSNGFKLRTSNDAVNYHNNYKYIYLAWAESPFKYARGK